MMRIHKLFSWALLAGLLALNACAARPAKPGCSPGWSGPIVAQCALEMHAGTATEAECIARVDAKADECVRP